MWLFTLFSKPNAQRAELREQPGVSVRRFVERGLLERYTNSVARLFVGGAHGESVFAVPSQTQHPVAHATRLFWSEGQPRHVTLPIPLPFL